MRILLAIILTFLAVSANSKTINQGLEELNCPEGQVTHCVQGVCTSTLMNCGNPVLIYKDGVASMAESNWDCNTTTCYWTCYCAPDPKKTIYPGQDLLDHGSQVPHTLLPTQIPYTILPYGVNPYK